MRNMHNNKTKKIISAIIVIILALSMVVPVILSAMM